MLLVPDSKAFNHRKKKCDKHESVINWKVILNLWCGPNSLFFQSYRVFILIRGPPSYDDHTYFYSELLAHVNPLLNPLVYVLCNKQYRASIKELFTKSCCKRVRWWLGEKFYLTSKKNDVYHYSLSPPQSITPLLLYRSQGLTTHERTSLSQKVFQITSRRRVTLKGFECPSCLIR